MINGVYCHEQGCPDAWKDYAYKCVNCGRQFKPRDKWEKRCNNCKESI